MSEQNICPVLQDGRELARISAEVSRIMEDRDRFKRHSPEHARLEIVEDHLSDADNALRKRVLDGRAESLGGAMAQLVVMFNEMSAIVSHFEGADVPSDVRRDAERRFRRVGRAAYSILRVVEASAHMDREDVAGEVFMPRRLDPHERVEAWRATAASCGRSCA